MRILITLDDVIRAKTLQIGKIYKKHINKDINLDEIEINSSNLGQALNMTEKEYKKFLYEDYMFEIFGEASVCTKMLDKNLNLWHIELNDDDELDEPIEIIIGNPLEFNASIGCTYFFLSKIATRVRETYFPIDSIDLWNKCDIMITADNELLNNKPLGKISVKITTDYNKECKADFTYNNLQDILNDEKFIKNMEEKKND